MHNLTLKFKDDWRYTNQDKYLAKKQLRFSHFNDQENDHSHCEFCFAKFSNREGDLHEGYCTLDGYRWICKDCYEAFQSDFEWQLVK